MCSRSMVSNHRAMDHLVPCHKERIQIFLFCFSFFWLSQSCLLCFVKCVTDCGTDSSPPPCQWQKKVGYRCSRWCFKHKLFWNVYSRMAVSPTLCIDKGWCWSVRLWTPWPFNFCLANVTLNLKRNFCITSIQDDHSKAIVPICLRSSDLLQTSETRL